MRSFPIVLMVLGSASFLGAQNWTAWRPDAVYSGIETRARCTGFNEFANRFVWDVQLRNTYQKNVDLAWAAEPGVLRGSEAQADHAISVKPGEVIDAHHTAPNSCSAGLLVTVNTVTDVKAATAVAAGSVKPLSMRPKLEGRWQSKDPEPLRKEVVVQLSGRTVTTSFSSPNFNFQISTPLPEGVSGGVSIDRVEQK